MHLHSVDLLTEVTCWKQMEHVMAQIWSAWENVSSTCLF